jgi:lysophospholipase L1-like esterase
MRGFLMTCLILTAAAAVRAEELKIAAGEQIVAIGDSITQAGGYLRDIDMVFATQYPDLKIPKVINTGISGQKAEDLVGRFGRDVVARKPALVTIDIGINDVWHRLGQPHNDEVLRRYKENLERMVDAAQGAGIRVVLCTPTVIQEDPNSEGNKRLKLYCDVVRQIAADKKCLLADLHAGFIDTLAKKTGNGNQLTSDGVHMNGVGDWLMAEVIVGALGVPKEKVEAAKTAR